MTTKPQTAAKPPPGPMRTKGMFTKHVVGDRVTLEKFVARAVAEAAVTIKTDPYLKAKLVEIEADPETDLKKAYDEVDYRVARAVNFYLRNRSPNERVRAKRVSCTSATDLLKRTARCIVEVVAWGHMRRVIIDLELPQP